MGYAQRAGGVVIRRRLDVGGVGTPAMITVPTAALEPAEAADLESADLEAARLDSADLSEAVVFVHGNPGSGADWADLVRRVGAFAPAVAMDMPGFGSAAKVADFDYTVSGYAAHLEGVLAALGIAKVHLVLHDFGGPWGLSWAAANSGRLASLTLVNTGVLMGYRWHYLARIWRTPLLGELFMATTTRVAFRALLRHGNPWRLPREFADRMYDDFDPGTKRAVLRLYRATSDPAGASAEWHQALKSCHCPVLVIWGAHDPYLPARLAQRQRATFPQARVEVFPDSGHWPFIDDPRRFGATMLPFLRDVFAGSAAAGPKQ
ncbi:alpha/beta hydrolase [Actinomadura fulvescens]